MSFSCNFFLFVRRKYFFTWNIGQRYWSAPNWKRNEEENQHLWINKYESHRHGKTFFEHFCWVCVAFGVLDKKKSCDCTHFRRFAWCMCASCRINRLFCASSKLLFVLKHMAHYIFPLLSSVSYSFFTGYMCLFHFLLLFVYLFFKAFFLLFTLIWNLLCVSTNFSRRSLISSAIYKCIHVRYEFFSVGFVIFEPIFFVSSFIIALVFLSVVPLTI